jgi:hypothetical protein
MIELHLYGRFRRLAPNADVAGESVVFMPVEEGDTIEEIVRRLGIDPDDLSHLFLNAEYSGIRRRVKSGDRLGIFPREMGLLYRQYFPKIE